MRKRKRTFDDLTVATAKIVPNSDTNLCFGEATTEFVLNPDETNTCFGVATTEFVPIPD